jgi:hypothetical protein
VFACAEDLDADEEEEDVYWRNKLNTYGFEIPEVPIVTEGHLSKVWWDNDNHCRFRTDTMACNPGRCCR